MLRSIAAKFELVTPAMAGGAEPDARAELRTDAIIGQLRRWWWAKVPLSPCFPNAEKIANALFGAAGDGNNKKSDSDASGGRKVGGQSAFLANIAVCKAVAQKKTTAFGDKKGISDLLGPLWKKREQALWSADKNNPHFELEFMLRPKRPPFPSDVEPISLMSDALRLWGLLGGIGAGQRRGFGGVQLLALAADGAGEWREPVSIDDYARILKEVLGLPNNTGFTTASANQQFAAFTNRVVSPPETGSSSLNSGIYISKKPYSAGVEALSAIADAATQMNDDLATKKKRIIDLFSDGAGRVPSSYHLHVVRLGREYHVAASVLPCGTATYSVDLIGRMQQLFDALKMKAIVP